jgi:hypothetical protein
MAPAIWRFAIRQSARKRRHPPVQPQVVTLAAASAQRRHARLGQLHRLLQSSVNLHRRPAPAKIVPNNRHKAPPIFEATATHQLWQYQLYSIVNEELERPVGGRLISCWIEPKTVAFGPFRTPGGSMAERPRS